MKAKCQVQNRAGKYRARYKFDGQWFWHYVRRCDLDTFSSSIAPKLYSSEWEAERDCKTIADREKRRLQYKRANWEVVKEFEV